MTDSIFEKYMPQAWPHEFAGTLVIDRVAGGIPTDPKIAEGWIKSKIADKDDLMREAVAQVMVERDVDAETAAQVVDETKHLNGFKRDDNGLYIEGRQLKACIKEAASVARAVGKLPDRWGLTRKGIVSFVAEHVCVVEDRLYLGVDKPSGVIQRFVHTFRGSGIQYEEYVEDAKVSFTVRSDHDFSEQEWAMVWLTAQEQGVGASRSQGFGRFTVVEWQRSS
jgi:hypothetical protein